MSEEESILKKYTRLRNDLAEHLRHLSFLIDRYRYDEYIEHIKRSIETLNKRLSLDDKDFLEALYQGDISSLLDWIRDDRMKILQGDSTQFLFEYTYGKY